MSQPGYQEGSESKWWLKTAVHLTEAYKASINAMAHNVDSQTQVFALQDVLKEAQKILLEIFKAKGLVPKAEAPKVDPPAESLKVEPPAETPPAEMPPAEAPKTDP